MKLPPAPPPEFDREPDDYQVLTVSPALVKRYCRGIEHACAIPARRVIVISDQLTGATREAFLRHERGHLNGWKDETITGASLMAKPPARIAKSLAKLRAQVNALAPKRSKASDGWIGDPKHAARKSDHNPEDDGSVDALDLTHDPKNGVDIQKLCDAIVAAKDRRIAYLICNGKIISGNAGPRPWVKRTYTGANKHTKHLHVSVLDKFQDDEADWDIAAAFAKPVAPAPKEQREPDLPRNIYDGKVHQEVLAVQRRLDALGYPEFGSCDGRWGTKTRAAVLAFRADNGLPLKPSIDEELLAALMTAAPRVVAPERANATVADLRKKGSDTVISADVAQTAGAVATGAGGIAAVSKALEPVEEYSGIIQRVMGAVEPIYGFLQDYALLLLLAVGGVVVWQAWRIKKIRVEEHRTAQNVSL